VLARLADADAATHEFQAAIEHARAAIEEASGMDDRVVALRAEVVLEAALGQTDPAHTLGRTRQRVVAIREELETLGDEDALVQALLAEAVSEFYSGRCDRARQIAETVLAMDIDLDPLRRREIITGVSVAVYFGSTPIEEALVLSDRLEPLGGGRLVPSMWLSHQRMALFAMAGREEEALAEAERSERLMAEIANPTLAVTRLQARGEALIHLGRLEDAAHVLREGIDIYDSLGETGFNSTMTALLAGVLCRLGRFDEAEHYVERSIEMGAEDDFATQAEWRFARARVLTAKGEHDEALRLLDQAMPLVEETDYLTMRADAFAIRGLVLRRAGRPAEARAAFERAIDLFEQKGAVPASELVRADLAALPG
jgi:tetratricopeptide (TPR) repeat protein